MQDRKWSRVKLFETIGADLGYADKSRSAILPLLIAKEPTPEQAAVLRRHFGDPPPEPEPVVVEEPPTLAAALSDLAAELKASREERDELEGRLQGLEEAVKLLAARARVALPERSAPRVTAG